MRLKRKIFLLIVLAILISILILLLTFNIPLHDDEIVFESNADISVVLSTSDFSEIHHDNVVLISDERMKIKYKDGTEVIPKNEKYVINKDKLKIGESIQINTTDDGMITIESIKRSYGFGKYFGSISIYCEEAGFVIVNTLPVENYLRYVVPSEMPSDYGLEALKAQTICARNFALQHVLNPAYPQYNACLDDSVRYQVYNNQIPNETADKAISETKNLVMTYNGEIISAYYYSTSWGHSTDLSLWSGDECAYYKAFELSEKNEYLDLTNEDTFKEYLINKSEAFEANEPWFRWTYFISLEDIATNMKQHLSIDVNTIENIKIVSRRSGGGVSKLEVTADSKVYNLTKESEVRNIFIPINSEIKRKDGSVLHGYEKCPSSYYLLEPSYENDQLIGYVLSGGGCGHGLGMSQNCAKILAHNGMNYKEILNYFYPETNIEDFDW